jgi:hypothetical protein
MNYEVACDGIMYSDMVIREQGTGKLSLIGVFTQFNAKTFPFTSPPFFVTAFLTNFQGQLEQIDITVRIEQGQSAHVLGSVHGKVNMGPKARPLTKSDVIELPARVPPMQFPEEGTYFVTILVDGQEIRRRALTIRSAPVKKEE